MFDEVADFECNCNLPRLLKGLLIDKGLDDSLTPTVSDARKWIEELEAFEMLLVQQMQIVSKSFNDTFIGPAALSMRLWHGKERNRWNDSRAHRLIWTVWGVVSKTDANLFQNKEIGHSYLDHLPKEMVKVLGAYERVRLRMNTAIELIRKQKNGLRHYLDNLRDLEAFLRQAEIPMISAESAQYERKL